MAAPPVVGGKHGPVINGKGGSVPAYPPPTSGASTGVYLGNHAATDGAPGQQQPNAGHPMGNPKIRAMQLFLMGKGYKGISPTGVVDRATMQAQQAWHARSAADFKTSHAPKPPANTGRNLPGGTTTDPGNGGGNGGNNQQKRPPAPGLQDLMIGGRSIPDIIATIMKGNGLDNMPQVTPQHVDPGTFGGLMAQMQFGPQIAEIQRQQQQVQANLNPQLANIDAAYGNAGAQVQAGHDANQATAQQMQGSQDNILQALAGTPGMTDPAVTQALGADAATSKGLLAQQALAQSGLDNANAADVRLQQANSRTQATNQTNQSLDQLRGQLIDALSQRGMGAYKNAVDAMQMNDQFRGNAINDQAQATNTRLAQALAGPQITASRLGNVTNSAGLLEQLANDQFNRQQQTAAGARADAAGARADVQAMDQHQLALLQAQLAKRNLAATTSGQTPFYKVAGDPANAAKLHNAVWSGGLVNGNGQVVVNPQAAYTTIMTRLKSMFPNGDLKRLNAWAQGEVRGAMPNSGWKWNGKRFVNTHPGGTATGVVTGGGGTASGTVS
jgi:hypothetical protein